VPHIIKTLSGEYEVITHASQYMVLREITDEMVRETISEGYLTYQESNQRDRYEKEIFDKGQQRMRIIRVVINLNTRQIISVHEDTEPKGQQ
jgi:hypothetical protein